MEHTFSSSSDLAREGETEIEHSSSNSDDLARVAVGIAAQSATAYLKTHGLQASTEALANCLSASVRMAFPKALADAREAYEAHMGQVGEATFRASMALAGIEAAKEAGLPVSGPHQPAPQYHRCHLACAHGGAS